MKKIVALLLVVLMALSLVISVLPIGAHAVNQADIDAIEKEKNELADKRATIQDKIDAMKEQQASVLEQKAALDERNEFTAEQLKLVQEQISIYDALIKEKAQELDAAKEKEAAQLERYRTRVCAMEESGGYSYGLLAILLKSGSFGELLAAIDDMNEVMRSDRELEQQYVSAREATEKIKTEYEETRAEFQEKKTELKREQTELKAQLKEAEKILTAREKEIRSHYILPRRRRELFLHRKVSMTGKNALEQFLLFQSVKEFLCERIRLVGVLVFLWAIRTEPASWLPIFEICCSYLLSIDRHVHTKDYRKFTPHLVLEEIHLFFSYGIIHIIHSYKIHTVHHLGDESKVLVILRCKQLAANFLVCFRFFGLFEFHIAGILVVADGKSNVFSKVFLGKIEVCL